MWSNFNKWVYPVIKECCWHPDFKDFKHEIQGPDLFSRTFKALKMRKKIQRLSRTCGNPELYSQHWHTSSTVSHRDTSNIEHPTTNGNINVQSTNAQLSKRHQLRKPTNLHQRNVMSVFSTNCSQQQSQRNNAAAVPGFTSWPVMGVTLHHPHWCTLHPCTLLHAQRIYQFSIEISKCFST